MASWQDYAVWAVVLAAAAEATQRLVKCFRKGREGCTSCASANCPLKRMKK